jgi:hypothetical protein
VKPRNKEAGSGVMIPNRPKRKTKSPDPHSTPLQVYRGAEVTDRRPGEVARWVQLCHVVAWAEGRGR